MELFLDCLSLSMNDRSSVGEVRPDVNAPDQVLVLERKVPGEVPHVTPEVV